MNQLSIRSPSAKIDGLVYFGRMLDKIRAQQERVFKLADQVSNQSVGKSASETPSAEPAVEGEDMAVSIGNTHQQIHYHLPAPAATTGPAPTRARKSR